MKTQRMFIALVFVLSGSTSSMVSAAPVGTSFTYQGRLTDGGAAAHGSFDLRFDLFDSDVGPNQIGNTLTNENVTVTNGLFATKLDFGAGPFNGTALWLQIGVRTNGDAADFTSLNPRQPLTPAPYALYTPSAGVAATAMAAPWVGLTGVPAGFLDGIDNDTLYSAGVGLTLSGTMFRVNFGGSGALDQAARSDHYHDSTYWKLTGNSGTIASTDFLGTTDNQPLEFKVNNARALRLEPNATSPNVISGHADNLVSVGVLGGAIGGGGSVGAANRVTDDHGTVGGGLANQAGDDAGTTSDRFAATVGGGAQNKSSGQGSFVGGGVLNINSGTYATLGGGIQNNVQAAYATLVGGFLNTNNGEYASVGGGVLNRVSSIYATVAGGSENSALSPRSTVGGGQQNLSAATAAIIAGGQQNTNTGQYASIPGGLRNEAVGDYSLAAGRRARANHQGAFVWADSTDADFASSAANQLLIRATGGVGIGKNNPSTALDVNGTVKATALQGDGSALALLNADNISAGTVADVRIAATMARDSEILPTVLASDGSGSGLDADLLDGLDSSAFASVSHDHDATYWKLGGNSGTLPGTHFLGTTDNQGLELAVNNSRALRLEPTVNTVNVVGGFSGNFAAAGIEGATIGGGGTALYAPFGFAYTNRVFADFGTIGGGFGNTVRELAGTIGGGFANNIQTNGHYSFIGGGAQNSIRFDATAGTIGGGVHNILQSNAFNSAIVGGERNAIDNDSGWSFIGAGERNTNQAGASWSVIGGGSRNSVAGSYATVPGGRDNAAGADYASAAGRRARAGHQGAFVWADSTDADFTSTAANQFLIRAAGGVGIGLNNPATALQVAGTVKATALEGDGSALTSLNASGVKSGTLAEPHIDASLARDSEIFPTVLASDGSGSGLNADLLDGLDSSAFSPANHTHEGAFWLRFGNGGTTPGMDFVGTTDNQALEFKVNNLRALRLEPNASSPNVIGGFRQNYVSPGVAGAVIAGGGTLNDGFGNAFTNRVEANYGNVGGGLNNAVSGPGSTVGGGAFNTVEPNCFNAAIGGGFGNTIQSQASYSAIAGGNNNIVSTNADYAIVAGGRQNVIQVDAIYSTLSGGWLNTIEAEAALSTIGGGYFNIVRSDADECVIAGGRVNIIESGAHRSTLGGGTNNIIQAGSLAATISGGRQNTIQPDADHAFIGGGRQNTVGATATHSMVGGGFLNSIQPNADWSSIGGGFQNIIQFSSDYGTIAGGRDNVIETNVTYGTIGGGRDNTVQTNADYATISGGRQNTIHTNATYAAISGGSFNTIQREALNATICGGSNNVIWISADNASIGGGYDNWVRTNALNSTVGGGWLNTIEVNSQSSTIGGGFANTIWTNVNYGTIGGGGRTIPADAATGNRVDDHYGTVAGGGDNRAGNRFDGPADDQFATVGGGLGNWATHQYTTVAGGFGSIAQGAYGAIGGGAVNSLSGDFSTIGGGEDNSALENWATIAGGKSHSVSGAGIYGTIGGGRVNRVQGRGATVPGGEGNSADGDNSFAAGLSASVAPEHPGCFLFADHWVKFGNFNSAVSNEFAVRANGGVRFVTREDNFGNATAGVRVASGGSSWSMLSDRNAKENFRAVNCRQVLERLTAIPIQTWNYKTQEPSIRHIGPMAQDFATFDVGEDSKHINTIDADGVALAAIQGLNELLKEKDGKIAALEKRLEALEKFLLKRE